MTPRRVALRRRLLLLVAAGILPIAAVSGIALFALWSQQRSQAERLGVEIARALSSATDAELRRATAVLEGIAVGPAIDEHDFVRYQRVLERTLAGRSEWRNITLANLSGQQVLSARRKPGARLPMVVDLASLHESVRSSAPVVGALSRGPSGQWGVPVRVPVVRDGTVRFVLTAAVKPEVFVDVLSRQRLPGDWVVSVFDANGLRVARSRQHEEFLGKEAAPSLQRIMRADSPEGTGVTYALEGDRVYTAYSRSPASGWTVAIGMPPSVVEAAAVRSVVVYGGGIVLSLVMAVVAALAVGRSVTRPMNELRSAAQALGRREPLELPQTPITEIRQVADSLAVAADERARGELEREQLLEREQQARAMAEEANRSKDEFLAMLGHELRNPVGAIANATHLLAAKDDEASAHARSVISRQVQHLARMTDDLLDAARAMTGKIVLHRQALDLAEAAARSLSTLRATGRTGRRRLVQHLAPAWVDADPTRIEQIIGNLLGNALKFTREGGTITVTVALDGNDAVLRVADDGIGMPAELTAKAFEPFVQGERPLDRSYGGLGIGLTLVRRLAELHGGSAEAHSEGAERGAEFTIRLPAVSAPGLVRTNLPEAAPARSRDILIVEDSEDARDTLRRMLELEGHRVRTAVDGRAGLEAVRASPPEIALIDLGLPGMDGFELARRITEEFRSAPAGKQRPYLVAVTGYGLPEDRNRTRAAGFDVHLVKPVDATMLAEVLGKPL